LTNTKKLSKTVKIETVSNEEKVSQDTDIEEIDTVISVGEKPDMITPLVKKSLTKQGYELIGSHSGVKLCRWTKSHVRGRGGCYKVNQLIKLSTQLME
jgi:tRNA wybutosine-synthesizing protein 1